MKQASLAKNSQMLFKPLTQARVFSAQGGPGFGDLGDVMKTNYTMEYDQGLTDEQKA